MKRYLSKYFIILFIGILLAIFTGCDHVELLEYNDEDTYAVMDSGLMAPPNPDEINFALNTIYVPGYITPFRSDEESLNRYFQAIGIVIDTLDLVLVELTDMNKTFSINELVDSLSETLALGNIDISKDTLREIIIITLNEAIREVKEHPEDRLDPDKTAYFALGERLLFNGYDEITEANADDKILDVASFVILSTMIQQAVSEALNESIAEAIIDYVPKDLQDPLLPRGIPIKEGTLPYFIKQTMLGMNDELNNAKNKKYTDTANVITPHLNTGDPGNSIYNPIVYNQIQNEIHGLSVNVILFVAEGSEFSGFQTELSTPILHQGFLEFGWTG